MIRRNSWQRIVLRLHDTFERIIESCGKQDESGSRVNNSGVSILQMNNRMKKDRSDFNRIHFYSRKSYRIIWWVLNIDPVNITCIQRRVDVPQRQDPLFFTQTQTELIVESLRGQRAVEIVENGVVAGGRAEEVRVGKSQQAICCVRPRSFLLST